MAWRGGIWKGALSLELTSPPSGARAALEVVLGAGDKRHRLHVAVPVRGRPQGILALFRLLLL